MLFKNFSIFLVIFFSVTKLFAADEIKSNGNDLNFFIGNFDFSDNKQSAYLIGFQHQDENLNRDTFLGNVSPITGGFITENSAAYVYTGIEWNIDVGEKEEAIVNGITNGLTTVFVDNPDLMGYLKNKILEE